MDKLSLLKFNLNNEHLIKLPLHQHLEKNRTCYMLNTKHFWKSFTYSPAALIVGLSLSGSLSPLSVLDRVFFFSVACWLAEANPLFSLGAADMEPTDLDDDIGLCFKLPLILLHTWKLVRCIKYLLNKMRWHKKIRWYTSKISEPNHQSNNHAPHSDWEDIFLVRHES